MSLELRMIIVLAAILLSLVGAHFIEKAMAKRAELQLAAERFMRRGWKTGKRFGLLPEDLQ